ncbi:MAG TPA: HD domain-containing phosphohydrolase [Gemmatimonadaceae bacterium]|nr:HD domain-containing phosphohydrolase [Gemmatimonadaceae bacterium]
MPKLDHLYLATGAVAGAAVVIHERRTRRQLERVAAAALETLLNAIEANDEQTGLHVRRVAAYALVIADAVGMHEREQRAVERVALFHDIGKIHEALFDIVHERARLSAAERRAVTTHPARGAQVLAPMEPFYPELPAGVLAHHERWDGSGYPRGLRRTEIPIEARIVAIADTFDAVTHTRRYRAGSDFESAAEVIARGRGTQFDPDLADLTLLPPVFARLQRQRLALHRPRGGRRERERQPAPDVTFRWRSESLRSQRVGSAQHRD